ncbi:MAG: tetratricopeptide repeat protein [Acidobacteriota bacterium]
MHCFPARNLSSKVCVATFVTLAQASSLLASNPPAAKPRADPLAEITEHATGAEQALSASQPVLAEHRARLALVLAYTALGRLEMMDSNPRDAESALARAAARAPAFALDARALLHGLLASQGRLDPALGELRLLTQTAPDHLEARRQLVLALVYADTLDEAALELEALRRLDAEAANALAPRLQARDPAAPEAGAASQPPIDTGPPVEPSAAEREAMRRALASIIARSEALLTSALASDRPSRTPAADLSPAAWLDQARKALADGRVKQALEHAKKGLDDAPSSEPLLRFYATTALDAGLTSVAAPPVETLARMDTEHGSYAFLVGRVWLQLGKTSEASEALKRAVELDPELLPARRELALALAAESRFELSKQHLELVLAALEDPWRDLDAQAALAEADEHLGDAEAAEARARRVLERDPGHARARLVLGLLLADRGDFELARKELEQSITIDPKLARAHYRLSFACTRLGDRDCADRHLELYRRTLGGPQADVVEMTRVVEDGEPPPRPMTRESRPMKPESRPMTPQSSPMVPQPKTDGPPGGNG